jgi:drug/metabolite transporter (DMT)-like permease
MLIAGACWGAYSLAGRSGGDPLGETRMNFVRASLLALPVVALSWRSLDVTAMGVVLAALSGSLASAVAYTLWYTVLPHLAAWRAAVVQLIVPVLTALAASVLLRETLTTRLLLATLLVAAGVWLTVWPSQHPRAASAR